MLPVTYQLSSWNNRSNPLPGDDFNVLFIGAGGVMFGGIEGPWNHSLRFESKIGPRLKVVAVIDPWLERCADVLQKKRASFVESAYRDTLVFPTVNDFVAQMTPAQKPRVIVIGAPPAFRGTDMPGRDLELQLLKHFPDAALLVEKPISTGTVEDALKISKQIVAAGNICSVAYMLRYLKAVQMMKQIIKENNLTVMATISRYASAYTAIPKLDWWDKTSCGGPIVEQGTHFCDLSRYFGGNVDIKSVMAHSVEWDEEPGRLSKLAVDETKIKPENRVPRVTSATWKYENGAVGSLVHLVTLQGTNYSCGLEVYLDGFMLRLVDVYNNPTLYVRRPGNDQEECHSFSDDDPYLSEVSNFVDVVEKGPGSAEILSSYEDACKTYEFSWAIREASEKSRKTKN